MDPSAKSVGGVAMAFCVFYVLWVAFVLFLFFLACGAFLVGRVVFGTNVSPIVRTFELFCVFIKKKARMFCSE